ncbi:MAG: hypothetical protein ACJA0N_002368, partial [Pseudohongiellaceae bacterium]
DATQTFVVRLALIVFLLPIFIFAGLVGAVDCLVERDLRRWGGRVVTYFIWPKNQLLGPWFILSSTCLTFRLRKIHIKMRLNITNCVRLNFSSNGCSSLPLTIPVHPLTYKTQYQVITVPLSDIALGLQEIVIFHAPLHAFHPRVKNSS